MFHLVEIMEYILTPSTVCHSKIWTGVSVRQSTVLDEGLGDLMWWISRSR